MLLLQAAAQVANDYLSAPSPLANMVTAAGVSAWTINKLKQWNGVPWINQNSDRINRAVSLTFALVTTAGLHIAFHDDLTGARHVEIWLPSASEFLNAVWRTLGSYIMQQGALRGFVTHEPGLKAADAVADVVKDHKEQIAAVVEREDASMLKLNGPAKVAEDVPVDFPWTQTKDKH